MRKLKGINFLILIIVILSIVFTMLGCANSNSVNIPDLLEYNVNFNGERIDWQPSFIEGQEQQFYTNLSFYNNQQIVDDNLPKERVIVINTSKEYKQIFSNEILIDFDEKTLLLLTFTTTYPKGNWRLKKLYKANETLYITLVRYSVQGVDDATMPTQKWIAITMDKNQFTDTKLSFEHKKV